MNSSSSLSGNDAWRPRVTVLGTLNIDHVWSVARLPTPGQTVLAKDTHRTFGGKGANQAVAAARQGARVALVGAVGGDVDGQRYREHLDAEHIDTSAVVVQAGLATGAAHVYVDDAGENLIVVDGGANRVWDAALFEGILAPIIAHSDILLAQLESPLEMVRQALRMAEAKGLRTVLNASPYAAGFHWNLPIDTVIVNEHECRDFFGMTAAVLHRLPALARAEFLQRHAIRHLVITQGSDETLHFSAESSHAIPTHYVEPRDTVGAGDTFAGALVVRLAMETDWKEAIWRANVAAALSTLSPGAQSAMPMRLPVDSISFPA